MIKKGLKLSLITLLLLMSCSKSGVFPDEPVIKFKEYLITDELDTVLSQPATFCELTISFTDGDGDIGEDADSNTEKNLRVTYYEMVDSVWTNPLPEDAFSVIIPTLTPAGQNKSLKGDISIKLNINNRSADSLKFDMQLIDRAKNASNIVTSPLIVVSP